MGHTSSTQRPSTPDGARRAPPGMVVPLLALISGLLMVVVIVGALVTGTLITTQKREIATLGTDIDRLRVSLALLEEENATLAQANAALRAEVAAARDQASAQAAEVQATEDQIQSLRREMEETMVPRAVGSSADFPIERAMAQPGERLAAFAKREGTSVEVLKALNPWVDEDTPLKRFQILWLPIAK